MITKEHELASFLAGRSLIEADHIEIVAARIESSEGDAVRALKEAGLDISSIRSVLGEVFPISFPDELQPPKPSDIAWAMDIQEFLAAHSVFPYKADETTCYFAVGDIFLTDFAPQLEQLLGRKVHFYYCEPEKLKELFRQGDSGRLEERPVEEIDADDGAGLDSPIVKAINLLFLDALNEGASDIHVEPFERQVRVRFRVDGVLRTAKTFPIELQPAMLSRIKLMAGINISEKRIPQDGRIKFQVLGADYDMRVNTLPSVHGETAVLRLLKKESVSIDLGRSGFRDEVLVKFRQAFKTAHGICLVTGPTGSGKTTTLYGAVNEINLVDRKIFTIEDPVEYQLEGIVQIPVNAKVGMTFAAGLRAALRQDPDIVMIGEIRDAETAAIAVKAALTGHLVLATLHTNSAPGTVSRLLDMGVENFMLASTLQAVLAQRLQRRICENCRKAYQPETAEKAMFSAVGLKAPDELFHGAGCDECGATGFRGRLGIHELLVVDDDLRRAITDDVSEVVLTEVAKKSGMVDLRADSLIKAAAGLTSLDECIRVTGAEATE